MTEPTPMRTVCLTCAGSGDITREVAFAEPDGRVVGRPVLDECWFCEGEGWLVHGFRREPDEAL